MRGASWVFIRERLLKTTLGGRPLGEILYPTYVRVYPWLYCMRQFKFEEKRYRCIFYPYGATLRGERIIEVPIVLDELRRQPGRRIHEVANVLSHHWRAIMMMETSTSSTTLHQSGQP